MTRKIITLTILSLVTLGFADVCYKVFQHGPSLAVAQTTAATVPADTLNAYGFYPDMSAEDFKARAEVLKRGGTPIVRWIATTSDDDKTVIGFGLVFPTDKFLEVAKEVASKNGDLKCEKDDKSTMCVITDKNGNQLALTDKLIIHEGKSYGGLAIVDADHVDKKNPKTDPESEHHHKGDVNDKCAAPTYTLNGKCVTDL